MRYAHTNLIARDWQKLSQFYQVVFNCVPLSPRRNQSGDWIDKITGVAGAHIQGEHLLLPGYGDNGPTLEVYSYDSMVEHGLTTPNSLGLTHLAFEVHDVRQLVDKLLSHGGSLVGEIVSQDYGDKIGTLVYARDPEGNIVEIQSWQMK